MKTANIASLILVIVGAVEWGLVGLFDVDIVASLFGGAEAPLARLVYVAIGLAGLYQLLPLLNVLTGGEAEGESVTGLSAAYVRSRSAAGRNRLR